ncbi:FAD:protein FMN transferase [Adhaeribacter swui]|uniref:FAD:protein FMN transferase n=1 Tax=Adhaeribacter swui TaxID=2086471 RepID=A0A7G7G7W6_9BACT|nr:FAD:protein FMN transferase [Adhaeribacter swui]QNF33250.1 FAD:protein FMN transferase [Adhaeribacter swui]
MLLLLRGLLFLNFCFFTFNGFAQPSPAATKTQLQRYEFSHPQMGTIFRIVLYAISPEQAQDAANAAFARIDTLNQIMSDYVPDSELNQLAATAGTGKAIKLSPDLWKILKISQTVSRETQGAFDITIGPLVQLWRRTRRQHQLPAPEALAKAKSKVGYQHIILKKFKKTAALGVPGMQLDLGAIGKGYAVDEAMRVLQQKNIRIALVDGGGNIRVSQAPPGTQGWEIDLSTSNDTDHIGGQKIYLQNAGVATSGDLYQFVEINGQRYSHIINPFTGLGLTDQRRVTIVAKNGTAADWLSTASSVLPVEQGLKLINRTPKAAAHIVWNQNNQLYQKQSRRFLKLPFVKE